jgi:hypothetical protein
VASWLPWRLEKALRPLTRTVREARKAQAAGGASGLASYLADRSRLLWLGLLGRGQTEDEIARVTMRYWNDGDKAGVDLKDYSHWAGSGPWQDREKWLALGRVHFDMYEQLCLVAGTSRPFISSR